MFTRVFSHGRIRMGQEAREDLENDNFVLLSAVPCPIHSCSGAASALSTLAPVEFGSLAARCAPGVPGDTLLAIARTESGLNPNAISINRPKAAARVAGYPDGELFLSKQPKNLNEAKSWPRWLSAHHYAVSVGLMQVNDCQGTWESGTDGSRADRFCRFVRLFPRRGASRRRRCGPFAL